MTLIPIRFDEFDISTPSISGLPKWFVGYDQATNRNVRYNFSSLSAFLTSNMNILILARSSTNHLEAAGAGAGLHPSFRAAGANTNINLRLGGKGTGRVVLLSDLDLAGLTLYTNNGDIITGGGDITTGGGSIDTGGGDINAHAGNILTSGNVVISGNGMLSIPDGGTFVMNNASIDANGNLTIGGNTISAGIATATFFKVIAQNLEGVVNAAIANLTIGTSVTFPPGTITIPTLASTTATISTLNANYSKFSRMEWLQTTGLTAVSGGVQGDGLMSTVATVFRYTTVATPGSVATLPDFTSVFPPGGIVLCVQNLGANWMNLYPPAGSAILPLAVNEPYKIYPGQILTLQLNATPAFNSNWSVLDVATSLTSTQPIRTMTSSGDIGLTDSTVLLNHGTSLDATLPTAVGIQGKTYTVKNIGTDANLLPDGSETIDGAASVDLDSLNKGVTVQSDGANWQIINKVNF